MYRAAVEGILGIQRRATGFTVDPSLPPDWPGFKADLKLAGHRAEVEVQREPGGDLTIRVNGREVRTGELIAIEDA